MKSFVVHIRKWSIGAMVIVVMMWISSCSPEDPLNEPVKENTPSSVTALDEHIQTNFTEKYGVSVQYKYNDRFVDPSRRVVPARLQTVRPMLDFIEKFWIDPYLEVENGESFFVDHVPAEVVFIGGPIFNLDGTIILGTADAGAQITLTNVNTIDPSDEDWRALQLGTIYHEFAHTIHQRYKLPTAFETISPRGYTSAGSWFTLTDQEALERGFVSPYGTSSPNEDYAEVVAFFSRDPEFYEKFINQVDTCTTAACENANAGRAMIATKLSAISEHYVKVTGVRLEDIRDAIQAKL